MELKGCNESMTFAGFAPRLNMTGFTPIPNEFFDEVLPNIKSLAELKVILAVFRRTYGWVSHIDPKTGQPVYKEEESISMRDLQKMTGLSSASCVEGVKRALEDGYLERVQKGTFQGGHNESSVYRIKQRDANKSSFPTPDPVNKSEMEVQTPQEDQDVREAVDTAEETTKKDLLSEFFPEEKKEEQPKPKKRGRKTFRDKPIEQWNCNDLLSFFHSEFRRVLGFSAGIIMDKDRKRMKQLLEGYDPQTIAKAITFYIENYKKLPGNIPKMFPTLDIFFGYHRTLIPLALNPYAMKTQDRTTAKKNLETREFKGHVDEMDTGGYQWI